MNREEDSDETYLLEHPAGVARGLSQYCSSRFSHEMENLSLSDLTTGSPASQYPPSYHSRWDRDSEKDAKEPVEDIRLVIALLGEKGTLTDYK